MRRSGGRTGDCFDHRDGSKSIERLRVLLESSDGDSIDGYLDLKNILAGSIEKSQLDDLGHAIGEFDFERAALKLDEIEKLYRGDGVQCRE